MHSRIGRKGEFVPVDCADVLAEACRSLRAALDENRAVVTADPLPTVPAIRAELLLLFQNLIQNAVQYTKPGGHISIRLVHERDHAVLSVSDDGEGIPAALLDRVFEPFYRLESSRNRDSGGTGLGLSIARDVVQAHGGSLHLANATGGGLEATLRLPRRR